MANFNTQAILLAKKDNSFPDKNDKSKIVTNFEYHFLTLNAEGKTEVLKFNSKKDFSVTIDFSQFVKMAGSLEYGYTSFYEKSLGREIFKPTLVDFKAK